MSNRGSTENPHSYFQTSIHQGKPIKTNMKNSTTAGLLFALAMHFGALSISAVPYASGITRNGNTVSFVLNQNAASVEVLRNGANAIHPGTTAGAYSFDMSGFSTYEIKVTGNDAPGWTKFVPDQTSTSFEYPYGVSINKIPSSTNFGNVYVSQGRTAATVFGRTTSDGIYVLRADGSEAGFSTAGVDWTGNSAPYKSMIGPDGHLYVSDLSNDLAYELSEDLTSATQLIDDSNKTSAQWVGGIYIEGTQAGGDRKLYLVNTNPNDTTRKGIIRYDLGANPTATPGDTGTQVIGPTYYGASYYPYDLARDSKGDWYVNAYRAILNQMPAITKFNGAGELPLDDNVIWETDKAVYYYAHCNDINEASGRIAYGSAQNGIVYVFDMATGAFVESFDAGNAVRELAFDAAGNLVTVDNSAEWARFWSPGGYTIASTKFDGVTTSFQISKPATQVSVTASQSTVSEAGPGATFTISRVGSTAAALTVYYALGGTATNGVDYAALPGSAVIPASAASVDVSLSPLEDAIAELTETIIVSVSANSNYSAALPANATVSILDNENPEIEFAPATAQPLLESYAPSRVTQQIVRRGSLAPALTVNLAYSGTASRGADFNGAATVALAAGAATADLVLSPINDQAYEGDEVATASVAAGTGYSIGSAGSASVSIVDDEVPAGTVLFSDNFDLDSSAQWQVNAADPSDCFVDFAWNYSDAGIPLAPGGGTAKGLRMRCGNTILQIDGLSVSPIGGNFTNNYRLRFDLWINYNGPMPDGGPGSTQNFDAGMGTAGNTPVWLNNPNADGVWFSTTGDGADGNTGGDYNALIGPNIQNDDNGFYAAGTGTPNSGLRNSSHPFYALWGGQAAPDAQLALYPNQTGVANVGNAGMAWHSVVITKVGDVVSWAMDGITIATVTNTVTPFDSNIFVGYQDLFASGSLSDVPEMSFGLVDNLRVETYVAASAPLRIKGIQLINGGTQVEINFTAGVDEAVSSFALQSTGALGTAPGDVSASITSTVPGQFRAVRALGGTAQFYRVRRL
jgi:hypothetical protein